MYNTNNSYQWHCTICLNTVHLTKLNDQCTCNRNLFTIKKSGQTLYLDSNLNHLY